MAVDPAFKQNEDEAGEAVNSVIVAGSRSIKELEPSRRGREVRNAIEEAPFEIDEVVSGTCEGVDKMGEFYAEQNGLEVQRLPALWDVWGKSAGPRRNSLMVEYADALIAVWDGESRGTEDVIEKAQSEDLDVHVYRFNPRGGV
jgi:hypothetical protein